MLITKAQWSTNGENVRIGLPLTKIDKENRIVSGFASLDNADSQDDIMTKDANERAFSRFRGNIREMHQPIAVGKMVNFRGDTYYDPESDQTYDGIWVDVYVSKGAQDTWEKVLDGTLQGFSIGGSIIDSESQLLKSATGSRMVRFIKDYRLTELSLVDSPANSLANVFSFTKVDGGDDVLTGMIADTKTESVFWCDKDKIAKTSFDEKVTCPNGHGMESIGWIEYNDTEEKVQKMSGVVDDYLKKQEDVPATNGGGVSEMSDENKVDEVEAPEVDESKEVEVKTEEVEDPETALTEKFDEIKELVKSGLNQNSEKVAEALKAVDDKFEELKKSVEAKFSELTEKHSHLTEKFDAVTKSVEAVEKSLSDIDESAAFKKSGDLGGSTEPEFKKSDGVWSGSIFS